MLLICTKTKAYSTEPNVKSCNVAHVSALDMLSVLQSVMSYSTVERSSGNKLEGGTSSRITADRAYLTQQIPPMLAYWDITVAQLNSLAELLNIYCT